MTRKPKIKVKARSKRSILCEKREDSTIKDACVFIAEHKVWAVCKGKQYADGRFRYIYNGREGIADAWHTIIMREGITKKHLKDEAIKLNLTQLQSLYRWKPKRKLKATWEPGILEGYIDLFGDAPIVAQEPE